MKDAEETPRGIIAWFAGNPVAANLLLLGIVVLGLMTLPDLRQEVMPTIDTNRISVSMAYPGAAPEEVERGLCARIEEAVRGITGIDRVTSTAAEGMASVSIELLVSADDLVVLGDVQSAIDRIDSFPADAEEPVVSMAEAEQLAMQVIVWGDCDERVLRAIADEVEDELSNLEELSQVSLANAPPYELSIEVREADLARYGLSFDDVVAAVRRGSLDLPGGSVRTRGGEVLLRGLAQAYTGPEFAALTLRAEPDGTRLSIGDVATVRDGFAETDQSTRFDGHPAVVIEAFRVGEQDALAIGPAIEEYLAEKVAELPAGVHLSKAGDETSDLRERRDLMLRNGQMGLLLVLVSLALFLRLRLALWVTIGIPASFLGAIWLMPGMDVSINMISLFGFIIVLGIIVDDAIVVAENIHRRRQLGETGLAAAAGGALEVAKPVVFAVLTTIVAFTPMLFMPGTMGQFSRNVPLIVIATLVFSLVESLWILPAHLRHLPAEEDGPHGRGLLGYVQHGIDRGLQWVIDRLYVPSLRAGVAWRYATVAAGMALFVVTLALPKTGRLKFVFFPQIEADDVTVQLVMPLGTPVATTAAAIGHFEEEARTLAVELEQREGHPVVRSILTSVGSQPKRSATAQRGGRGGASFSGGHLAEINLELVSGEEREVSSREIAKLWRARAGDVPGAEELLTAADLMRGDGDVDLALSGPDFGELREVADAVAARLRQVAGVTAVRDNFRIGKRQLELAVTPAGEAAGLTTLDLARQVRQAFHGDEAQSVQRGRDEVDVYVRYPRDERERVESLERMRLRMPDGRSLPFSAVATLEEGRGYSEIKRLDGRRTIDVLADLDTKVLAPDGAVAVLTETILPEVLAEHPRVAWSFEGRQREQADFMATMQKNAFGAVIAIFVLLAVSLRSYRDPLAILFAIPFGVIGAFWGHILMGFSLSMFSVIGVMALSGIVINDSLVLIDLVGRMRREDGLSAGEAVVAAARQRFRAILLTTLTTFAGLTPLLLEKSLQARFLIPMAVSLAFGVVFATVISLVLVPALYLILEDLATLPARLRARLPWSSSEEPAA